MSFQFTTERVLNDLSMVSVIDDSTTIAAPASPAAAAAAGGNLTAATYYYKVTAINAQGETVGSSEVSATTASSNLSVTVTWTAVIGATGYKVYRGTVAATENKYFSVSGQATATFTDSVLAGGTAGTVPVANTAYVNNDPGVPNGDKALFVKRTNKFLASNTSAVYQRLGNSPTVEIATITIPSGATAAGVYRLAIDVRMSNSYPITYDRWAINKGKPFYVEVNMTSQASATAFVTAFAPLAANGLKKANGDVINDLTITGSGTTLIITAANEYQRFVSANVENFVADAVYTTVYDFAPFAVGVVTTPGVEGFGTSWYLTKNVRIPTQEATRFYGEDQDERPVVGIVYNQYILKYAAARNIGGLDYVGALGTSNTDHIFWVPQSLASTFEGYITSAFGGAKLIPVLN